MDNLTFTIDAIRQDIQTARDTGTLTIPPYIHPTIHTNRHDMIITIDLTTDGPNDVINTWKYDESDILSTAVKTTSLAILQIIRTHSTSCYGEVTCSGTIIAIMIPSAND